MPPPDPTRPTVGEAPPDRPPTDWRNRTVTCETPGCRWQGTRRTVSAWAGDQLTAHPPLRCAVCGRPTRDV